MRLFLVPLIAYSLAPSAMEPVEPTERAMRIAFEQQLQIQVTNAMEFLEETGRADMAARIRVQRLDRFQVGTFRKDACVREGEAFRCSFEVDVSVVTGVIEQKMTGTFAPGPDRRLIFAQDS